MINTTNPYSASSKSCRKCSMSSIGPSLLVQPPVGELACYVFWHIFQSEQGDFFVTYL